MKYNLKDIMTRAWSIYRKDKELGFPEALRRAWLCEKAKPINADRIEKAKMAAGVEEDIDTWYGWKQAGYEVEHGSKRLFAVDLIWGSKGYGVDYKASFFGRSQVRAIA